MAKFGTFDWIILIGVALIAWILATHFRGSRSTWRGYWLANATLPNTNVAATYFGANLTFTAIFLILSQEAYRRGYVTFCIPIYWILGSLLFVALYSRISPAIAEGKTLHQVLRDAYGSRSLQLWASLWTILAFVGTVGLEFYGGIMLIQWTGLSVFASSIIGLSLALICSAFTISGGFRGIAVADIFLDLFAFAACAILLAFSFSAPLAQPANATIGPPALPGHVDKIIFAIGMGIIFIPF